MKKLSLQLFLALILTAFQVTNAHAGLSDFLEKKDLLVKKAGDEIANIDVNFNVGLGDVDILNGINIGLKSRYEVEPSYLDQYYTRLDGYTVKGKIDVGEIAENFVDLPFSFSVSRENTFYFVRQFHSKKEALKALPYSPKRLPVNAERALKNLDIGDFVSMPANMNIAVEARAKTSMVAPVIISANAGVYMIVSGEFTIQVFKLDATHVRLKILSKRSYNKGADGGIGLSFDIFGVRIVDRQLEKLVDKDFVQYGYEQRPGEQFIVDYVFDLDKKEARDAYDQILKSTVKFKETVAINKLKGGENLRDKLISSFEKAEALFETDKLKAPKERRVSRIFKGFNDYKGDMTKLKLAMLMTSYKNEKACTENKVTFVDKNETDMEYFYPTCSDYTETSFGKWIFDLKDQDYKNTFGLIPKVNKDEALNRDPDFGLNYERRDKAFRASEQRVVQRFLLAQMPKKVGETINLGEWQRNTDKKDSKILFQLTLKAQGFNYLRTYSEKELYTRLKNYYLERKNLVPVTKTEKSVLKLKSFLHIGVIKEEEIQTLASSLFKIIKNDSRNSTEMLTKLVNLSTDKLFDKVGVGFLISLLPDSRLEDLIYVNLNVKAKDAEELNFEYGRSNYRVLYKELTKVQTRIAAQTYDLRISDEDHEMEDSVITESSTQIERVKDVELFDETVRNELF